MGAGLSAIAADEAATPATPAAPANAEAKPLAKPTAPAGHRLVQRIDEAVGGLTAEQKLKIQAVMSSYDGKIHELKGKERRAAMDAQSAEIRAVLTPDQQAKFDAMPKEAPKKETPKAKENQKAKHKGHKKAATPAPAPAAE
ncbi:hypothetical protein DB354_04140 [Opitutus sp. ER46]|nr:hypothetical protein DB354_04140 [Opitutus sp. ER46]